MKMIIQLDDENPVVFANCLREIAEKVGSGNLSGTKCESGCEYYFTIIDDAIDSRKFIIYSNDGHTFHPNIEEADHPIELNYSQIMGVAFGSCMKKAFQKFLRSDIGHRQVSYGFRNFIVRETIGEPYYENIK